MERKDIRGYNFEVVRKGTKLAERITSEVERMRYVTIWDAYDNPSNTKENIWKLWDTWFRQNEGVCSVSGHNCFTFSLIGETPEGAYLITPAHNYVVLK